MPWYDFIWNTEVGGNVLHIAEHGFSVDDAESIVCRPLATGVSRRTGRPMALGTTSEGRLAVVVYELIDDVTVFVVTAFEVDA